MNNSVGITDIIGLTRHGAIMIEMKNEMSRFCGRENNLAVSAVFVPDPVEEKGLDYTKMFLAEREH
jgi:hypothetical protein